MTDDFCTVLYLKQNISSSCYRIASSSGKNPESKSNGDMQGEQFINGALDINATIRAYQVSLINRDLKLNSP